jgi:phage shock protein PspC (stress-responsive transcriptional regulator)
VIAGVCAGLARRFGWDVTLVRVLAVVSILLPGPQVIVYLVMWLVIPQDGVTATTTTTSSNRTA